MPKQAAIRRPQGATAIPPSEDQSRKILRQSLPQTLAASLQERILNGEFGEGYQLIQEIIAEEYGVSRMPVREALRQLEAAGLVELKTHKGATVTSIPIEQIGELFELRALIECEALSHAIPMMTPRHLEASKAILGQLEHAYHENDIARWGALNWEFHRSLYEPSGRIQTMALIQSINVKIDRYIRLQLLLTGALDDAEKQHRKLLRLCATRNVASAVAFLRDHILEAGRNLRIAMQQRQKANDARSPQASK